MRAVQALQQCRVTIALTAGLWLTRFFTADGGCSQCRCVSCSGSRCARPPLSAVCVGVSCDAPIVCDQQLPCASCQQHSGLVPSIRGS